MGRFASTAEYYSRFREPYPPQFFQAVAKRLALTRRTRLLDIGCGPAPLAIGFAPLVASVTGVDPEPNMLAAARDAAQKAGVKLELIQGRAEGMPETLGTFDMVTIGRALHWFDRATALPALERVVGNSAYIVICGATASHVPANRWAKEFNEIRRAWSAEIPHPFPKSEAPRKEWVEYFEAWFAGSRFRFVDDISVVDHRQVAISDLVGRALSMSTTSPEALGDRRKAFEQAITNALEPYAQDGVLVEEIIALATVFR